MPTLKESALKYLSQGFSVIPFYPKKNGGCCLSSYTQFRDKLPTEAFVKAWWDKWPDAMIAIVGGKLSDICMVDCDSQESLDIVNSLLPDNYDCPIDITPRAGPGHHFYFRNEPTLKSKDAIIPKLDFKGEGGVLFVSPSIRNDGQYKPLNGCALNRENLQYIPDGLLGFLKQHIIKKKNINESNEELKKLWSGTIEGGRNQSLTRLVGSWIKLGLSKEECLFNSNLWNTKNNPPLAESEILSVIESVCNTDLRNNGNLAEEVREWVNMAAGNFSVTDVHRELNLVMKEQKHAANTEISRLAKSRVIEKYGEKRGYYRLVNTDLEELKWKDVKDISCFDISLPFEIERYVKIHKKSIIIVAGTSNSGKTAFMLNTIKLNMNKQKVVYFSSELAQEEMAERIRCFGLPDSDWHFNSYSRSSNFDDVINPEALNIIDFLEIYEDFFKVGKTIAAIHQRLTSGVAVIALQKNIGAERGMGGERSIEKARLYLTVDPGKIKITKGKSWANREKNPNGLSLNFKLFDGCKFMPQSGWINP